LRDYDLDSVDTPIYACFGDPQPSGPYKALTIQGGSTTVTSLPATGVGAFRNIAVGDEISLTISGTETRVIVATRASDYSITVSGSGVDLYNGGSGYPFTFRKFTSGTGADICWVNVKTYHNKSITVEVNQTDGGGGVNWVVEAKSALPGALPVRAWPADSDSSCGPGAYSSGYCNVPTASAGIAGRVTWQDVANWSQVRVGLYLVTSDASDAGANVEKISVYISADKP